MVLVLLVACVAVLAGGMLAAGLALARLRTRLAALEATLEAQVASSDGTSTPNPDSASTFPSVDVGSPGYLITRVGEDLGAAVPVARIESTAFADLVLKESVVQAASLAHGVRRALSAESRNRIRFHVRQEVRRARKQRRAEMRLAHREWTARQREAARSEPAA